jgi:hypothetical protein
MLMPPTEVDKKPPLSGRGYDGGYDAMRRYARQVSPLKEQIP